VSNWHERLADLPAQAIAPDLTVHTARTAAQRRRGLARMHPMPPDRALRLPRTRSIHTFGMRFALDLVWIGDRGQVVRIDRDIPPRRLKLCLRARAVIEARAGHGDVFAHALDRV
jgi:uncharacterized membrane protein (UPF0127 family)